MFCADDLVAARGDASSSLGRVCCVGADGDVHVHWLRRDDNDKMEQPAGLELRDRSLLHNDVVRQVEGGKCGMVMASELFLDLCYTRAVGDDGLGGAAAGGESRTLAGVDSRELEHM